MNRVKTVKKDASGARKRKAARQTNEMLSKYPKISNHFKPDTADNIENLNLSSGSGNFEIIVNTNNSESSSDKRGKNLEHANLNISTESGNFAINFNKNKESKINDQSIENLNNTSLNISSQSGNFEVDDSLTDEKIPNSKFMDFYFNNQI